jgi:hypothetical protein
MKGQRSQIRAVAAYGATTTSGIHQFEFSSEATALLSIITLVLLILAG